MKKRLEAELISIAHRILKLKNKSELDQLYKESQKLYETLSVLKFYQDNFESVKSEISKEALEEKLEQDNAVELAPEPTIEVKEEAVEETIDTEPHTEVEEQQAAEEEHEEAIVQEETEEELEDEPTVAEEPVFQPIFELEEEEDTIIPAETATEFKSQEKLEDMIGNYAEPVFVKPDDASLSTSQKEIIPATEEPKTEIPQPVAASVNEVLSKSIAIGLNDRIGFVNHLFNGSNEDFNRVISQLNTFDTFEEAKAFINEMVIPDYNYWVGEEEYIERFMAIVEKKFQ